jgi:aspartyl-tRNA(Asn)/glutamyl-tRNA(Gln) amidotransferase subunit A
MNEQELTALSITKASESMRKGDLSPVELTRAYLGRIEHLDGKVNSFLTVTADLALKRARWAEKEWVDERIARSSSSRLLLGIPVALKDLYETRGVRTTHGSRFYADYVPETDAQIVKKLDSAGAILLGKTNMHEIALGLTNVNPHYGACRNPWSLDRITGGSSGGSGAALAARFCMGALGTDTGGSIRVPASLCGVVGLKPTYGRVSLRGVMTLSWNLDHAGPMARRVEDAAILLQVIAGYDPDDPYSADVPVDDYIGHLHEGVKGWRVAFVVGEYFEATAPEIMKAIDQAAVEFVQLGARVERVDLSEILKQSARASGLMVISDAAALHQERLLRNPAVFGEDVLQRLSSGARLSASEYILARRTQTLMRWELERFFSNYDILLTPTTAAPAAPIEDLDAIEQARLLTRYTSPFNLTGLPALSLPCGFTSENLPIGLQIVGHPWAEAQVLRAAYAYEAATIWHQRSPDL